MSLSAPQLPHLPRVYLLLWIQFAAAAAYLQPPQPPAAATAAAAVFEFESSFKSTTVAAAAAAATAAAATSHPPAPQAATGTSLEGQLNVTHFLLGRFEQLFQVAASQQVPRNESAAQAASEPAGNQTEQSALLETRAIENQNPHQRRASATSTDLANRKYFRILSHVFSRVELPAPYKLARGVPGSSASSGGQSSSTGGASGALGNNQQSGHCAAHIGCIEEMPNFPGLFMFRPNVSAVFTLYSTSLHSEPGGPVKNSGLRIVFEPIVHHQLEDASGGLHNDSSFPVAPEAFEYFSAATNFGAAGEGEELASGARARAQPARLTASSWRSANKVTRSQELPFDLSLIEQSGFNSSLPTRVIIGGYFAKENEEWIEELVRQWLQLEPSNVIKVSWQDANRGLYHTAAYNSRIVGRQLSLFLYYLNELFLIDLARFHLVGHSLGAHIAGFVGADLQGKLGRITGLDPAGPIFVDLSTSLRLDASDAQFVDVMHTNSGTLTKGALGLATPSGHVDYYANGGSLQPGCYSSSVTQSIVDPVERVTCNHRRSYRYFTEIIRIAIAQRRWAASASQPPPPRHPNAFLFLVNKQSEDLTKLTNPKHILILAPNGDENQTRVASLPLRRRVEFHSLAPLPLVQSAERAGGQLYFLRTRSEAPFFGSRQFALKIKCEQPIRRKISLLAKINNTIVVDVELDELEGERSFVFAPARELGAASASATAPPPDLWLMWRLRSFALLRGQPTELQLSLVELSLLDFDPDDSDWSGGGGAGPTAPPPRVGNEGGDFVDELLDDAELPRALSSARQRPPSVRYVGAPAAAAGPVLAPPDLSRAAPAAQTPFNLARNNWHKFVASKPADDASRRAI